MAKAKMRPGLVDEAPITEAGLPPGLADAGPQEAAMTAEARPEALPRWKVTLVCPTLIPHPTLEVEAANEEHARAAFCRANGISASVHPWTIERLS